MNFSAYHFAFRLLVLLLICTANPLQVRANMAMPGLFDTGGMATPGPLPGDSLASQHISMVRERIAVRIYAGYAVVRGEYWFVNAHTQPIRVLMGYPLWMEFQAEHDYATMDSIHRFRALGPDGKPVVPLPDSALQQLGPEPAAWHAWWAEFPAGDTKKYTAYFLVHTNSTKLRKGYDRAYPQGFTYVLQSGREWAGSIGKGEIFIELMDGMTVADIQGLYPSGRFLHNSQKHLYWQFANLEPTDGDDVVLAIGERVNGMFQKDFREMADAKADSLYAELDNMQLIAAADDWQALRLGALSPPPQTEIVFWVMTVIFTVSVIGLTVLLYRVLTSYIRKRKSNRQ